MKDYSSFEFFTLCNRSPDTHLAQDAIWYLLRLLSISGLLTVPRHSGVVNQCVDHTWQFLANSDVAPAEIKQWVGGE